MSVSKSKVFISETTKQTSILEQDMLENAPIELQESEKPKKGREGGSQHFLPSHINNNNHHVVPVGVLIVLCTLYLTTTALQRSYGLSTDQHPVPENSDVNESDEDLLEEMRSTDILERFLEHENVCFDLAIFTKEIKRPESFAEIGKGASSGHKRLKLGNRKKQPAHQKLSNAKNVQNGQKYNNKSTKIKFNQNKNDANKKEKEQQGKKNSTAEPIIYLFALVFIYLLLKAASDINQHYKSKTKGDKRIRRCSLQSYAQTHKQDRRASKDSIAKLKQRQRLVESRCKSVDRYTIQIAEESVVKNTDILAELRNNTSVVDSGSTGSLRFDHLKPSTSKPEEISKLVSSSSSASNRRCSVPGNSLNYMRPKSLTGAAIVVPFPNMARRTSIAGGSITASGGLGIMCAGSSFDGGDPLFPEVKRRVRMINRH